ncbi:MAG: hypothetical protein HC913_03145 [Microscillaceae bacterium]|nr:hypothetical protein [Microscillaceae bacterium]
MTAIKKKPAAPVLSATIPGLNFSSRMDLQANLVKRRTYTNFTIQIKTSKYVYFQTTVLLDMPGNTGAFSLRRAKPGGTFGQGLSTKK